MVQIDRINHDFGECYAIQLGLLEGDGIMLKTDGCLNNFQHSGFFN